MPFPPKEKALLIETLKHAYQNKQPISLQRPDDARKILEYALISDELGSCYRETIIEFIDDKLSTQQVASAAEKDALTFLKTLLELIENDITTFDVILLEKHLITAQKSAKEKLNPLVSVTHWVDYLLELQDPKNKTIYTSLLPPTLKSPQEEQQMQFGYAELDFSSLKKPEKAKPDTALLPPNPTEERRATIASGERPVPKPRNPASLGLEAPKASQSPNSTEKPKPAPRPAINSPKPPERPIPAPRSGTEVKSVSTPNMDIKNTLSAVDKEKSVLNPDLSTPIPAPRKSSPAGSPKTIGEKPTPAPRKTSPNQDSVSDISPPSASEALEAIKTHFREVTITPPKSPKQGHNK